MPLSGLGTRLRLFQNLVAIEPIGRYNRANLIIAMPKPARPTITILKRDTLLAMIRGAVGSSMFAHLYATVNGKRRDILRDGELSCAFFVTTILHGLGLLAEPHATVSGCVRDLEASGWRRIQKPKTGSVILWSGVQYSDGELHKHVGFFAGKGQAISNSSSKGSPQMHDWKFRTPTNLKGRTIEGIFWHPALQ